MAIGIVPQYFDQHYSVAVNIYTSGVGLGVFIMPMVTEVLIDMYGWQGALLLFSGVCLNTIPCGALLRQRPMRTKLESNGGVRTRLIQGDEGESLTPKAPLFCRLPFITRVIIPGFVSGYTFSGWMIYIASLALSHGATMKECSIVASFGGIGLLLIKVMMTYAHLVMTTTHQICLSSIMMSVALILLTVVVKFEAMCATSLLFGAGGGILGQLVYVTAKETAMEEEQFLSVAAMNCIYGIASLLSGIITGKSWQCLYSIIPVCTGIQ